MQAFDAQGAEAVARAGVVMGAQVRPAGFGIDACFAVDQAGIGMIEGEQFAQHLLLGCIPVGLAEGLARWQAPAGDQRVAGLCLDRPGNGQVELANDRPWPGVEGQLEAGVPIGEFEDR